jgi:DNA-binding transcriptional MerR regulator
MQLRRNRAAESPSIPDRLYFRIGDVARICDVETYVLRFWETQFPQLKPNKGGTGQRLYRRSDVEIALEIKRLVHAEGYTLSGARQVLEQARRRTDPRPRLPQSQPASGRGSEAVAAAIGRACAELQQISALLSTPVAGAPRRRSRIAMLPISSGNLFPM